MSFALYVPIFVGELGWELINYVPHVNQIWSQKKYDAVHIVVRPHREILYPMGTDFYVADVSTDKSMANNGPSPPKNNIPKKLSDNFTSVDIVGAPPSGIRYIKRRKFLKYQASDNSLAKWSHIPENAITLLVRGRKFGRHKNWDAENWEQLCRYLVNRGYTPVLTGIKQTVNVSVPEGCIDVQNNTTMEDLLAVMSKSLFVLGQSTGPAHFASLSGIPHAIWGHPRLHERYSKSWNPHKTMVEYYSCKNQFEISLDEVKNLADKMCNKLKGMK